MVEATLSNQAWKHFIREGAFDPSRLNQRIIESWYRSKEADVNPMLEKGRHILTHQSFLAQKEKNVSLLSSAFPHLSKIGQFASDMGMMALIIDPDGYVLSIKGREDVLKQARDINFVEGVRWCEQEVGTNAIGTALQAKEPIMVTGSEHYSVASHRWSCAAAPIHDDHGKLLGILDLSCPVERAHPYMLGMVVSAAYIIEQEISLNQRQHDMELLQLTMDFIESTQLLIVVNSRQTVVGASKLVRQQFPELLGMKEKQIVEYGLEAQKRVPIISKNNGILLGYCIYVVKRERKSTPVTSITNPQAFHFKGETGTSPAFQRTINEVRRVAPTDASVYILGETGTGKEVIAQSIHENSPRRNGPFIAVNCGAIPQELMESELFGYVEGAFTGAKRQGYKGKFEQAQHGTIFLDEIGEIPYSMQVALLRVLQERKLTPVGGAKEIPLDIRIIAATHRDLRQLVNEGKFREDLYYRLHVYPILVPPLRERKEDIPHLVRYFCQTHQWNLELPPQFLDKLTEYHWPGNIRELWNVLQRFQILSQGGEADSFEIVNGLASGSIQKEQLPSPSKPESIKDCSLTLREKIQKEQIMEALKKTKGNVSMAAQLLGIPRSTFYKRLQKLNL